jgi:hypothetical protein
MPKKLLVVAIILLLAVIMLPLIPASEGNFMPGPQIKILEPIRQNVKIYENTPIPIILTIMEPEKVSHYHQITKIIYSIDEKAAVEIANVTKRTNQPFFGTTATEYHAYATIDAVETGSHLLTVIALDDAGNRLPAKTGFAYQTIDKYANVTIFSPLNMTYFDPTKLTLNFTADNLIQAYYSLDGIENVTYTAQNGTLHSSSALTNGEHTFLLRVYTEFGYFSTTIQFAIDGFAIGGMPSREASDKSSVTMVVILLVVVVVVVGGLLVSLKRGKPKTVSSELSQKVD